MFNLTSRSLQFLKHRYNTIDTIQFETNAKGVLLAPTFWLAIVWTILKSMHVNEIEMTKQNIIFPQNINFSITNLNFFHSNIVKNCFDGDSLDVFTWRDNRSMTNFFVEMKLTIKKESENVKEKTTDATEFGLIEKEKCFVLGPENLNYNTQCWLANVLNTSPQLVDFHKDIIFKQKFEFEKLTFFAIWIGRFSFSQFFQVVSLIKLSAFWIQTLDTN